MKEQPLFPEGFGVRYDGQDYYPVALRLFRRTDGSCVDFIDWKTDCPRCFSTFVISTPMVFSNPRRRCDVCKAPGISVKSVRSKMRKQIAGRLA